MVIDPSSVSDPSLNREMWNQLGIAVNDTIAKSAFTFIYLSILSVGTTLEGRYGGYPPEYFRNIPTAEGEKGRAYFIALKWCKDEYFKTRKSK